MKLKTKANTIILTNEDEIFKNTDYSNESFSIHLKELSPLETLELNKKHTKIIEGKEETDFISMSTEQLFRSIVSWEGIKDEEDNDIDITEENIKQIMLFDNSFAKLVLQKLYTLYSKKKKK